MNFSVDLAPALGLGAILAFYGWVAARGRGLFASPRSVAWRERLSGGALVAVGASIAAVKRAG